MDKALRASDELEKAIIQRIEQEYGKTALRSVRDLQGFFAEAKALEAKTPPSAFRTQKQQAQWRQRQMQKLLQKYQVESTVAKALRATGAALVPLVWDFLARVYQANARYVQETARVKPKSDSFRTQQQREILATLQRAQAPFSKIAFKNLEQAPALIRRLQSEMRQAIMQGEGVEKLAKRIEAVMQNGAYNARRIAQTERTRVQSQARYEQMLKLSESGVPLKKKWLARMDNRTRDTHARLNGAVEELRTPFANGLLYPGDPRGPAKEVINCRCVLNVVVGTAKALPAAQKRDILQSSTKEAGANGLRYIGKIDRSIYRCVAEEIITDEVIITNERVQHIKDRHPNDYEKFFQYMAEAILKPDYILENAPKTALVLKEFHEGTKKLRLVLRLATPEDEQNYQNSIITMMQTGEKKWEQNLRTKRILYKRK